MSDGLLFSRTLTGIVLILSIVLPVAGTIIAFSAGTGQGLQASFRGVEGIGEKASALRTALLFTSPALVLQLLGFGILALYLRESGDRGIWLLSMTLLIFAFTIFAVQLTFHGIVTPWAGEEWARTGTVPEFFEPMRQWMNTGIQHLFVAAGLLAFVGFGWAILETPVLTQWVGWLLVVWGLGWFVISIITRDTLPAALFLPPLFVGIAMLF